MCQARAIYVYYSIIIADRFEQRRKHKPAFFAFKIGTSSLVICHSLKVRLYFIRKHKDFIFVS